MSQGGNPDMQVAQLEASPAVCQLLIRAGIWLLGGPGQTSAWLPMAPPDVALGATTATGT